MRIGLNPAGTFERTNYETSNTISHLRVLSPSHSRSKQVGELTAYIHEDLFFISRHLEAEVAKWQGLVDKVRGDSPPDFDNQTLAVLRGRLVRYLMRSKEVG